MELADDFFDYFKQNVTQHYLDPSNEIRKTIAILINTFLRLGGVEMWPGIMEFLLNSLESEVCVETALETFNFIVEDSGSHLEEKSFPFLFKLLHKLVHFLNFNKSEKIKPELVTLVLNNLYLLIENCPNLVNEEIDKIVDTLLSLNECNNFQTRYHLGRCWLSILKIKKEILSSILDSLFAFFIGNFSVENYQMNFTSSEFFSMLIQSDEKNSENETNKLIQIDETVFKKLQTDLKE